MTYRSFFALELPAALRDSLLERQKTFFGISGVKWTAPENLHLTLAFLGDVGVVLLPALRYFLWELAWEWNAFPLKAKGIELFPARQPRMVWVSLDAENDSIYTLHKRILRAAHDLEINVDTKALKLHITLGRIKNQIPPHLERRILETKINTSCQMFDTITLYRSQLRPEGPIYNIIDQSKLQ